MCIALKPLDSGSFYWRKDFRFLFSCRLNAGGRSNSVGVFLSSRVFREIVYGLFAGSNNTEICGVRDPKRKHSRTLSRIHPAPEWRLLGVGNKSNEWSPVTYYELLVIELLVFGTRSDFCCLCGCITRALINSNKVSFLVKRTDRSKLRVEEIRICREVTTWCRFSLLFSKVSSKNQTIYFNNI